MPNANAIVIVLGVFGHIRNRFGVCVGLCGGMRDRDSVEHDISDGDIKFNLVKKRMMNE